MITLTMNGEALNDFDLIGGEVARRSLGRTDTSGDRGGKSAACVALKLTS